MQPSSMPVTEWFETQTNDGGTMRMYVTRPNNTEKVPVMLVFQEVFSVNAHIRDVANKLAGQGYMAIAPELFHRTAPKQEFSYEDKETVMKHMNAYTPQHMEADIRAAAQWAQNRAQADSTRMGVIGFCLGGRLSFLANAIIPLKAAVSFYGGIAPAFLQHATAQQAPLLLVWGGKDTGITPDKRQAVIDALDNAGKAYSHAVFSEAAHGFFCDQRSAYHAPSAHQAWALTTAYLKEYL